MPNAHISTTIAKYYLISTSILTVCNLAVINRSSYIAFLAGLLAFSSSFWALYQISEALIYKQIQQLRRKFHGLGILIVFCFKFVFPIVLIWVGLSLTDEKIVVFCGLLIGLIGSALSLFLTFRFNSARKER